MIKKSVSLLLVLFATAASWSCASSLSAHKTDQQPRGHTSLPAVIWRDPGRVASLNLMYGAGGKQHAPDPKGTFSFLKEDPLATSPKFDVVDRQGVEWKVKLGQEPQSETAAARFMWAAGYFVDEDYYLPEITVSGVPKLHRGEEFVSPNGTIRGARLERKLTNVEKEGTWDWFENPFVNTRELNGLRIMMSLLNNWDLKDVNNSIYQTSGAAPVCRHRPRCVIRQHRQQPHAFEERAAGVCRLEVCRQGHVGFGGLRTRTAAPFSCRPSTSRTIRCGRGSSRSPKRSRARMRSGWGAGCRCCPPPKSAMAFAPAVIRQMKSPPTRRRFGRESRN